MMKNNLFKISPRAFLKSFTSIIAFLLLHLCVAQAQNGPACDTYTNKTTSDGLGYNSVKGVYVVGSTVYAATLSGLSISSNGGATFSNYTTASGLGDDLVYGVYASGLNVYAATANGLSISTDGGTTYTNKTPSNGLGSYQVYGVYASGSTVYAATGYGLGISTNGGANFTNKTTSNGLGNNFVHEVYVSGSTVYAATVGGLSISTDGGATFTNKTTTNGLDNNVVKGVYVVGSTVYAATNGGLSISIDGGATFTNKTTSNGLGSNSVNGVYAVGSTIYAATDYRLSISTDGGATFTNKTTSNGLGSNIVNGVYASATTVYAATDGGLSSCSCIPPTSGGTIATAQSGISPFNPAAFTSSAAASGESGTLEYKWQSSTSNNTSGFSDIATSNSAIYDAAALTQTTWFKRLARVSCSSDWSGALASNVLEITVSPCTNPTAGGTIATAQSGIIPFNPEAFTSTVAASGETGTLEYKWQSSTTNNSTGFSDIASSNAATYDAGVLTQTTWFKRLARGSCFSDWMGAAESNVLEVTDITNGPACDTYTNKTTADGLGSYQVYGVYAIGNTIYAATEGGLSISTDGGATYINKTTSNSNGLGSNRVFGVYASGSMVYAATFDGLSISTDGSSSFTNRTVANGLGDNTVNGVYALGSTIYAATSYGLSISIDGGVTFTNKTTSNGLGSNTVKGVYASGSMVYAATSAGLSISTDGGNSFTNKNTTDGLASNFVLSVYASGSTIYVGTFGDGGLSISTDGGTSFTNRTVSNGLGGNTVNGVYALGSTIYAATSNGLSISIDGGATFTNRTAANGLGSYSVSGIYASATMVYAATAGGLSSCLCTPPTSGGTIAMSQSGINPFNPAAFTSAVAASGQSGTLEYKWQSSTTSNATGFGDIASSNTATYDAPALTQTTWFKRFARSSCSSDWTGAVESNVLKITVTPCTNPTAGGTIATAQSGINPFNPVAFTISAAVSGQTGTIEFKWQSSTTNNTTGFSDIVSSNTATYDAGALTQTTWFKRLARGSCFSDWTGAAESNVLEITVAPCTNPTTGGTIATAQSGTNPFNPLAFTNSAAASGQTGTIEYQWQSSTTNNTTGFSDIASSNTATYDAGALTQTTWFKRLARGSCFSDWMGAVESNVLEITIIPCINPTSGGTIAAAQTGFSPSFNPAAFTSAVAASGHSGTLEYKWQSSTTSNSAAFNDITSSNTATYDAGALTQTSWFKRLARVSCSSDWTGAVESNVLEITVAPCINPTSGGTITASQSGNNPFNPVAFTNSAAASGHSGILEYQWQSSTTNNTTGFSVIASSNTAAYDAGALTQTTWFKRLARVSCSSDWMGAVESNVLEITVTDCYNPTSGGTISAAQSGFSPFNPAAFTSSVAASGQTGTLEYKWQSSYTSIGLGFTDIASSNSATYDPGSLTQTTWFKRLARVNCSNSEWIGAAVSNVLEVTVIPCSNPNDGGIIAGQPSGTSPFNPAAFTSIDAASGETGILEYKWQMSSTNNTTGFSDIASSNAATYDAGALTQTTWFKRLARVSCSSDWGAAVESNVLKVTVIAACATSSTQNITTSGSYTWNGQSYTSSGIYTFTGTNAAGCDSTATLTLTITTGQTNGPFCDTYTNKTMADGLGSDAVYSLYTKDNTIYAGTIDGLSISTDGGTTYINRTTANGLGDNFINDVYAIGSTVIAATNVGLSISTNGGASFTDRTTANGLIDDDVSVVFASGNIIYAASYEGLNISTDGGTTFTARTTANGLPNNRIYSLYAIDNMVYVGTTGGLSISTDGGTTFTTRTTANGLGDDYIISVYAIGSKVYASTGVGLSISTDGGDTFTTRTTANGLGNNFVNKVYAIGNTVYAATFEPSDYSSGGLSISTDGGATFTNYTEVNGLGSLVVTSVHVSGNTVYASTAGGVSSCSAQACTAPSSGGTIAAAQSGTSPFNPAAFTSTVAASGESGTLEYKWQASTTSSSTGFTDISSSNTDTYDAGSLSVTTWYKRLARVSCSADWTGAVESNVLEVTVSGGGGITKISGKIGWRTNPTVGILNTSVALTGDGTGTVTTLVDGLYSFDATGSNYEVTPTKTTGKLNGVTALDVTRIAQHVGGTLLFTNPLDFIAADINKSNTLNSSDASTLENALLNNPISLSQFESSWRFVPTGTMFLTPYGTGAFWSFAEKRTYTGVSTSQTDQDFNAVKVGDLLSPSVNPTLKPAPAVPVVFAVPDVALTSGAMVEVPFRCEHFEDLVALQACFWFNPSVLALDAVLPLANMPIQAGNFGTWELAEGRLRLVWAVATAETKVGNPELFKLRFRVLQGGQNLSEVLSISQKDMEASAWHTDYRSERVELAYTPVTEAQQRGETATEGVGFELYQNEPNPFEDKTVIGFQLPAAASATLTVYDAAGRVVFTQQGDYAKGYNAMVLDRSLLKTSGVLYYTLETATASATKKMIQMK
jgi:hypothetical protein